MIPAFSHDFLKRLSATSKTSLSLTFMPGSGLPSDL